MGRGKGISKKPISNNAPRQFSLPAQIFAGDKPEQKHFRLIRNITNHPKPKGGLWTSSLYGQSSAWGQSGIHGEQQLWKTELRKDLKIFSVQNLQDLKDLKMKYPIEGNTNLKEFLEDAGTIEKNLDKELTDSLLGMSQSLIDYESFSKDYNGLHMTQGAIYESMEVSFPGELSTWDTESTLWTQWCFDEFEQF